MVSIALAYAIRRGANLLVGEDPRPSGNRARVLAEGLEGRAEALRAQYATTSSIGY